MATLSNAGFPVPEWFVVLPDAFVGSPRSGTVEPKRSDAQSDVALASEMAMTLDAALARLCDGDNLLAVRSSAVEEDSAARSFAGQLESFVAVPRSEVADHVLKVWRSGFSERIKAYRDQAGLTEAPRAPAVVVQCMIEGSASGVAFSADPVSGRRTIAVVAAVRGRGAALVSGEKDADTWRIKRDGSIVEQPISAESALDAATAVAIAELAVRAERVFGVPQDIEWTIEGDRLYLLQSRPITTLSEKLDPDGTLVLWDNANIVENYGGVTTPMTFSFIRHVYEQVYIEFARLLGVSDRVIHANADVFRCMVGFIDGRVYYNLLNWHRILAMLPGYTVNRRFFEQMLGVGAAMPTQAVPPVKAINLFERSLNAISFARAALGIAYSYILLSTRIRRFHRFLDDTLNRGSDDLPDLRPDELVARYRVFERHLQTQCGVPALNDFAVMVHHGLLRQISLRWFGEDGKKLCNELLSGERETASGELTEALAVLAKLASKNRSLVAALVNGDRRTSEREMRAVPGFEIAYRDYLYQYGCRFANELKLESPRLEDEPTQLLRAVGHLAGRLDRRDESDHQEQNVARRSAEARAHTLLAGKPLRRVVFCWLVATARARLRERERLRFARAQIFDQARRIMTELGKRFAALGRLEQPKDVFFLEIDEVLGFVEGWATTTDLKGLVALRKDEHERFEAAPPPPDRFETYGIANIDRSESSKTVRHVFGESMQGVACCPGVVRGKARLVSDPRTDRVEPGDIVVAERTDPGWVIVFPSASGLLVERGNLLSHAAIVAREYGLPTIVSLPGLTSWLADGDPVEMDGGAGTVTRIQDDKDSAENREHGD